MVDRSMMHFVPDEIMKYFDGNLEKRRAREHLSSCVLCRSRLKDLALTRILVAPPISEASGEHVQPEMLARYIEDTLSTDKNRGLEEHFSRCRRCLSDLISLKKAVKMPLDHTPPGDLVQSIKKEL
jgi:anti-sigma factor RsiW